MLALSAAILLQLDAIGVVTLVFHGHVVFAFATAANQSNFFSHNGTSLKKADRVGLLKISRGRKVPPPKLTYLFDDLGDDASADCAAAFTDSEAETFFAGDRGDQFALEFSAIAGHDHFFTFAELNNASHVGGSEIELGSVS